MSNQQGLAPVGIVESRRTETAALDRASTLHPFTNLAEFAAGRMEPMVVESASGVRVTDATGRTYIDGFAGLYCVNIGYGRAEVADAIARQAHQLAYYHSYAGSTTDELARLSARLVKMAPGRMSKVFYGMSGSDANETNAKLVWYYNNLRGLPKKKKIISRERAYHGCSVVSGSMTGMSFYHDNMDLPVAGILHAGLAHYWRGAEPGESEIAFAQRRADELEAMILLEGPETVGAFIAEPVLGTGGIIPPPQGYWPAVQAVLAKYDVLLIADEVICGFGRIGTPFGSHRYGMEPDLVTAAKGLTSAYVPLSASIISEKIFAVMEGASSKVGPFSHGYTYSGHPIGAAAANAVLDIVEREQLPALAASTGAYMLSRMQETFAGSAIVGEVRGVGMLACLEFVPKPPSPARFDPSLKVGARISAAAKQLGLIARGMPQGDMLGFAPPLIMSRADVDDMVEIAGRAVAKVTDELTREGALH